MKYLKYILWSAIALIIILFIGYIVWLQYRTDEMPTIQMDKGSLINLSGVGGYEFVWNIAERRYNPDESRFWVGISAEVGAIPNDKFYEGWLVNPKTNKFFSIGKLEHDFNDYYGLEYTEANNRLDYSQVVITEETLVNGLDGIPEKHILEGTFARYKL